MSTVVDIPLVTYPTLTEAAGMLGVSGSTLSRRVDLRAERMGERDRRIPAAEVMRLAVVYRKRALNEVAADLIDYAHEHAPAHTGEVDEQVQRFFGVRGAPAVSGDAFLAEAKRTLPAELYAEVVRVYRSGGKRPPALVSAD